MSEELLELSGPHWYFIVKSQQKTRNYIYRFYDRRVFLGLSEKTLILRMLPVCLQNSGQHTACLI